jgi:DNA repair protein RadC
LVDRSGDPTPSESDIKTTTRLRRASEDLELPLLDHLIVAGDEMNSVGLW